MVLFYKIWKICNEIRLTKNKMDLNNRKIIHHPRVFINITIITIIIIVFSLIALPDQNKVDPRRHRKKMEKYAAPNSSELE